MNTVIDLTAYRERRARKRPKGARRPQARTTKGEVVIELQRDGAHQFVLRGAYAESLDLAVEAMAEAIVYLMERRRASGLIDG